ncbi:ankyrin repeat-containing domain protein [Mycena olivaceomarginata]|nr:ankyrin repeat-containing domain protein [Mycena olivaceomarginata]
MAVLSDLPPELVLLIAALLLRGPQLVPDLPSINALSRTCTVFHYTLNQHLYDLCASVEPLGKLALLFAVEHGLESTVDKLFSAGISLDTEFTFELLDLCNLLQISAALGLRTMVVKILAMYGEKMMAKVLADRDGERRTPLNYAARNGHMEIVKLLAPIPSSVVCSDPPPLESEMQQYLGDALRASARAGDLEISQYLIIQGADVNFLGDDSYPPPLFYGAGAGNLGLVQLLLASGADPNLQNRYGARPLFNSANLDVAKTLVAAGADIHATDITSQNVLAHTWKDIEMFRFFLECGVDPNLADYITGDTPLHHASSANSESALVELLLQFGAATVEKVNLDGYTPVHIAMDLNNWEVVKILEPLVQNPDLRADIDDWSRGY